MEYNVIYSARRTVSLCIKDAGLVVKAPYGTSKARIEEIVKKHEKWIDTHLARHIKKMEKEARLTDDAILELKKKAKMVLPIKTAYYAEIMGLKYGRITITSAKTRFGSCTSKGNISFSYRLMLYPNEAIDYVVVHELAHLVEMNHSPAFYRVVERVLPDYKERRKLLKTAE